MLQLSILEQSIISKGVTAENTMKQTVQLAKMAEQFGYKRFWVSEHHNDNYFAGSSPEILIAHIASKTNKIRVGSGGVMLSNHSTYKIAENFRVLEGLTPGRVDMGMGRAPGGISLATSALRGDRKPENYSKKIDEVLYFLNDSVPESHKWSGLKATPIINTSPDIWLLGSSASSAKTAAEKGLSYTFALFINDNEDDGALIMESYVSGFNPSVYQDKPQNSIAVIAICGETKRDAERMASSLDYAALKLEEKGTLEHILSPNDIKMEEYSELEKSKIEKNRKSMIIGDIDYVEEELYRLSRKFNTNEIILNTINHNFNEKLKSFERIAKRML